MRPDPVAAPHRRLRSPLTRPRLLPPLAAGAVLVLTFGLSAPIFEAPDEVWHFAYVQQASSGRGLPVQRPGQPGPWAQEGSQPPLYYYLAAVPVRAALPGGEAALPPPNPHRIVGDPFADPDKAAFIHSPDEHPPFRAAVVAVYLARLVSVAATVGLLTAAAWATRRAMGRGRAPLLAVVFLMSVPQVLFIGGSVSNDLLLACLAGWIVVQVLDGGPAGPSTRARARRVLGLGALLGLAALTKVSGLVLLPLALIAPAFMRQWGRGATAGSALLAAGAAALVAAWWYLRNWILYGDPLGTRVMLASMGAYAPERGSLALLREWGSVFYSFWGVFGWFNIALPQPAYALLTILALLPLLGLGMGRLARRGLLAYLALWPLALVAALGWWSSQTAGSQGRLLFPGLAALAVLWAALAARLVPRAALGLTLALPIASAGLALWGSLRPAYAVPLEQGPAAGAALEVSFPEGLVLHSYDLSRPWARTSEQMEVEIWWRTDEPSQRHWSSFVHLVWLHDYSILAQSDRLIGGGMMPTSARRPGEWIRDRHRLLLPAAAGTPIPGVYRLRLGPYEAMGMGMPTGRDAQGLPVDPFGLFVAWVPVLPAEISPPQYELNAVVGGAARLLGFDLDLPAEGRAGVRLLWEATADIAEDWTVFVHLTDGDGRRIAQHDGFPAGGHLPTSAWQAGMIVPDRHPLELPAGAAGRVGSLLVGMYRPDTLERLSVELDGQPVHGEALDLMPFVRR